MKSNRKLLSVLFVCVLANLGRVGRRRGDTTSRVLWIQAVLAGRGGGHRGRRAFIGPAHHEADGTYLGGRQFSLFSTFTIALFVCFTCIWIQGCQRDFWTFFFLNLIKEKEKWRKTKKKHSHRQTKIKRISKRKRNWYRWGHSRIHTLVWSSWSRSCWTVRLSSASNDSATISCSRWTADCDDNSTPVKRSFSTS